jgi:hypothetical protein
MSTPPADPSLDQLRSAAVLQEHRFRSRVPIIGPFISRFREIWNGVSTKWYVRPLIQQQSEINQQLIALLATQGAALHAIETQRAQDAARLARYDEQLTRLEERLTHGEARLRHQDNRQQDHDAWLIEQDREQSATIHDLSDTALRLVQANKRLIELEHRLAVLETDLASPVAEE